MSILYRFTFIIYIFNLLHLLFANFGFAITYFNRWNGSNYFSNAFKIGKSTEYNDEYHSVDLMNVGTSEIYFSIPISKNCIKYDEFNTETKIDVVKVDFIDGKTGETWSEFDGLYQAVCGGKVIYNHSTDGNTETK